MQAVRDNQHFVVRANFFFHVYIPSLLLSPAIQFTSRFFDLRLLADMEFCTTIKHLVSVYEHTHPPNKTQAIDYKILATRQDDCSLLQES